MNLQATNETNLNRALELQFVRPEIIEDALKHGAYNVADDVLEHPAQHNRAEILYTLRLMRDQWDEYQDEIDGLKAEISEMRAHRYYRR